MTIENLIITDSGDDLTAQNAGIYIQHGADRVTVRDCDIAYSLFGLGLAFYATPSTDAAGRSIHSANRSATQS